MTAPIKVKLLGIVGFLAAVEIASGTLQGFYTPIVPQITQHLSISTAGANWFEAAQLVVSALIVPVLARLGDLKGHRKVLRSSTELPNLLGDVVVARVLHRVVAT